MYAYTHTHIHTQAHTQLGSTGMTGTRKCTEPLRNVKKIPWEHPLICQKCGMQVSIDALKHTDSPTVGQICTRTRMKDRGGKRQTLALPPLINIHERKGPFGWPLALPQ